MTQHDDERTTLQHDDVQHVARGTTYAGSRLRNARDDELTTILLCKPGIRSRRMATRRGANPAPYQDLGSPETRSRRAPPAGRLPLWQLSH